ncbi:efflux RND transporter periplasmic adaptor subunit [Neptunomonas sp.]|uniref:efflux RND transporter periplasmic adaptor subunit n=1 Tax=Neptunomonas sp. TaxID=1971898 RepID=UPI003567C40D
MNILKSKQRFCGLFVLSWLALPVCYAAEAQSMDSGSVRAQLVARHNVILSSELSGRVDAFPKLEGQSFKKGDKLFGLDCTLHQARLAKAKALYVEARKVNQVNTDLDRLGSISTLEMDVSNARLGAAGAEKTMMNAVVDRCQIYAPFSGKVVASFVERHQFVAEGQEMLSIIDDAPLEVETLVPSNWLMWLKPQQEFELEIDESGRRLTVQVSRISPVIDPVSRSVKIFGRLQRTDPGLMPGMSGVAIFAKP